jgi:hypothetical protein
MARTSTAASTRIGIHDRQRILSSLVTLAFVRMVVARRGMTAAKARQIYPECGAPSGRQTPHRTVTKSRAIAPPKKSGEYSRSVVKT